MSDTNTAPENGWNGWNMISSVWGGPRSPPAHRSSMSDRDSVSSSGVCVREDQTTEGTANSYAASLEEDLHSLQINDQYIDLNDRDHTVMSVHSVRSLEDGDDEKDPDQDPNRDNLDVSNSDSPAAADRNPNTEQPLQDSLSLDPDGVMISQTLTLKTRNEELEKERAQLQSESLQLRMQTEVLKQSNQHIIAAQQQEIERLQSENQDLHTKVHDKDEQLKQVQAEMARIKREKDNLRKKLDDILNQRSNVGGGGTAAAMAHSAVLIENKHIIYGCLQCGQHLFDSSAMVQRQIEIDEHSFGLIVDCLFNSETTMGPTLCKTFLNGMFKVRELYCDGCLGTFGWKICESFDEWNTFHQNKYCVLISNIKQVSHT